MIKKLDAYTIMQINNYAQSNQIYNMSDYKKIISFAPASKGYTDDDYLDYFVTKAYEIVSKEGKININTFIRNVALAAVFENSIHVNGGIFNEETKQKILQFVPLYKLKVEQGFVEQNDTLVKHMEGLCEHFVGEVREEDFSGKSEAMYIQEIASLMAKNKELEEEINKEKTRITRIENSNIDAKEKLERKEKTIKENNELIDSLQDSITSLKGNNNRLEEANDSLSSQLDDERSKNEVLSSMIDDLNSELTDVKNANANFEAQASQNRIKAGMETSRLSYESLIDEVVLENIITKKMTIDMLVDALRACGHNVSGNDIKASLYRLQNDRGIKVFDDRNVTIPKYYHVTSPILPTNKTLSLEVEPNSCLDMLLTSDYHVRMGDNDQFPRIIDLTYDYCKKNNIGLIINLGDLMYSFDKNDTLTSTTFNENERLMDYIVSNIPQDDGIAHVVLGGNHDREHARLGVDPVTYVTQNRDDMINLGYEHATIKFNNSKFDDDFMMIHHNGLPREEGFANIGSYTDEAVAAGVKFNKAAGNDPDKTLLNAYGHQHVARLDPINKFVITPALTQNRGSNGAWHLKIYFDENKKVKYMIFVPIYFEKYVKKGYETVMEVSR